MKGDDDGRVAWFLAGGFVACLLLAAARSARRERDRNGLPEITVDACSCRDGETCSVCAELPGAER